jgi:hypothetical protein
LDGDWIVQWMVGWLEGEWIVQWMVGWTVIGLLNGWLVNGWLDGDGLFNGCLVS